MAWRGGGGGGYFMDLVFGPTSLHFSSCQQKSQCVNNLSVLALGSLPLPAMRYVSAAQSYLAFGFPFVSL